MLLKRYLTGLICIRGGHGCKPLKISSILRVHRIEVVPTHLPGPTKDFLHVEFGTAPIEALPTKQQTKHFKITANIFGQSKIFFQRLEQEMFGYKTSPQSGARLHPNEHYSYQYCTLLQLTKRVKHMNLVIFCRSRTDALWPFSFEDPIAIALQPLHEKIRRNYPQIRDRKMGLQSGLPK